jgi:hypothetical protein
MAVMRWKARPELKERLVVIHGSLPGFLEHTIDMIGDMPEGRVLQKPFLSRIINGNAAPGRDISTPMYLVVALTRIAEDDLTMPSEIAMSLATRWFSIEGDE